jgi:tRNA (mo5U34)-methyltransferase
MQTNPLNDRRKLDFSQELATTGWYHSMEFPGGELIEGYTSISILKERYAEFGLPEDLRGKRTLDIGAWDGWFSFEMERRGAEVTAVDVASMPNFLYAHRRLRSRVTYIISDVIDLDPKEIGQFDYVLFLGVLYHVRHPLLSLESVCALTREVAIVDSFVIDGDERTHISSPLPFMEFYEADELGGQLDNWFGPTTDCLISLIRAAGFVRPEHTSTWHRHARVICHRRWMEPSAAQSESCDLDLRASVHSRNFGINFASGKDEYISCYFRCPRTLQKHHLMPDVGGFAAPPIVLRREESGDWIVVFRVPSGLSSGRHPVRLRTKETGWTRPDHIYLDYPVAPRELEVTRVADGLTWDSDTLILRDRTILTLWVCGLSANSDRNNTSVTINGLRAETLYIGPEDANSARQINCLVGSEISAGGGCRMFFRPTRRAVDTISESWRMMTVSNAA